MICSQIASQLMLHLPPGTARNESTISKDNLSDELINIPVTSPIGPQPKTSGPATQTVFTMPVVVWYALAHVGRSAAISTCGVQAAGSSHRTVNESSGNTSAIRGVIADNQYGNVWMPTASTLAVVANMSMV